MENMTATQTRERNSFRLNLRENKAKQLASSVLNELDRLIPYDCKNQVWEKLVDLFMMDGIEILTDHDREQAGLPPRGPEGWTTDELIALEKMRLDVLMKPISMVIPK